MGIEVFLGKGWRANRGSKEAEAGGEFSREGGTKDIYSFGLVEYWEIVSVMEVASVGLRWKRSGIGEWSKVEVRMHIFIGLTKHFSGAPMAANRLQRN